MSELKLKPCPFCGGEATMERGEVWCSKCFVNSAVGVSQDEAVKSWNTRTPQSEWVSVGDITEFGNYIVTDGGRVVAEMTYTSNKFAKTEKGREPRFEWRGRISPWEITHFMRLPKPLKGD